MVKGYMLTSKNVHLSDSSLTALRAAKPYSIPDIQTRDLYVLKAYENLRPFLPLALSSKVSALKLASTLLASPQPTPVQTYTLKAFLRAHPSLPLLDTVLTTTPGIEPFREEITLYAESCTLRDYHSLVTLLVYRCAHPSQESNVRYVEYLIVKLYRAGFSLPALSLYCDLALHMLDNQYFDRFRELVELELASHH